MFNKCKNYDLCVNYYGTDKKKSKLFETNSDYFFQHKHTYLKNILLVLSQNNFWRGYKYILKMDDDLAVDYKEINLLFDSARKNNFVVSQPSFQDVNLTYKIFRTNPTCAFRTTTFTEIQMPLFERSFLEGFVLPLFKEYVDDCGLESGWGVDAVWSKYCTDNNLKMAIIDDVIVKHLVKTSTSDPSSYYSKNNIDPFGEAELFSSKYNITNKKGSKRGWSSDSYYAQIHNAGHASFKEICLKLLSRFKRLISPFRA